MSIQKKMSDLRFWRDLRLGGPLDTAALMSIASGAMCSLPQVISRVDQIELAIRNAGFESVPNLSSLAGMGASAFGAALLSDKVKNVISPDVFKSRVLINSDKPKWKTKKPWLWDGILIGYCTDTGKPVIVSWEEWMRHGLIVGQSGVGKTVMAAWVMFQQIAQGGGLIFIDGKLDRDNLMQLRAMAAFVGREDDLLVINPGDPSLSNTYNPILYGDPDEVSSRVLSLIPSSEGNAGTDYYRQAANQGIATLVGGIQKAEKAYNFIDFSILLQNPKALSYLDSLVPATSETGKAFKLFLEQYKVNGNNGSFLDMKKLKETFGGIGGRMYMFGTGNFGMVTNSYNPEVNLYDAIRKNKIVYVALPTMGKNEAASNFGKMVCGDFRTAISWIQNLPKPERPWPPFLFFADEAGSYVTDAWARPFEQARSAHLSMLPAIQTMANLDAVSEELREMVLGNTNIKIAFQMGTHATAEVMADFIGKEHRAMMSTSTSGGKGTSSTAGTGTKTGVANSESAGITERPEEVYRISPDTLKNLENGEAIVTIGGTYVYHVKVPRIQFDAEWEMSLGDFHLNQFATKTVPGLGLMNNIQRWVSGEDY